jgi:hypothetical protein
MPIGAVTPLSHQQSQSVRLTYDLSRASKFSIGIHNHSNRTARTFGENLFVVLPVMAPFSQEEEPPANSGRFSPILRIDS